MVIALRPKSESPIMAERSTAPGVAAAQTAPPASEGHDLTEVVVTAQKRSERLQDVPLSVAAVSGEQLAQQGIGNLQELVRVVPGFRLTTLGAFATPSIRGVSGAGNGPSSEVSAAIFLDGVYLQARNNLVFNLPDVASIEVLKGPQSTLSGRSAIGGTILISTLEPTNTFSGMLRADIGGYDGGGGSGGVRGFVSGPVATNLNGSVSFGYDRDWGFVRNVRKNNQLTGGSINEFVRGKLRYQPNDQLSVLGSAFYSKSNNPAQNLFAPYSCATNPQFASCIMPGDWHVNTDVSGYSINKMAGGALKVDYDLGEGVLTSASGYLRNRYRALFEADGTPAPGPVSDVTAPTTTYSQEFTFASKQRERFSYILGASAMKINDQFAPLSVRPPVGGNPFLVIYDTFKTTTYAVYGELTYNITDKLVLVGGIRYIEETKQMLAGPANPPITVPGTSRKIAEHTYDYWAPRLSARYKLTNNSNVYATYSTGFKTSAYVNSDLSGSIANPETLKSYEIGYKVAASRYNLNVAAYTYRFNDIISGVSRLNPATGAFSTVIQNATTARFYGLDVDGSFYVTPELLIAGGFAYQPTAKYGPFVGAVVPLPNPNGRGVISVVTDRTGGRLPHAPKFSANLRAEHTTHLSAGDLVASGSLYHTSAFNYDAGAAFTEKAYTTADANLSFQPRDAQLRASVWVKNLTNKAYSRGFYNISFFGNSWAPPRQYGITLEQRW